jgi:hypothetical protein
MKRKKLSPLKARLLKIALVLLLSIGSSAIVTKNPEIENQIKEFINTIGNVIIDSFVQSTDSFNSTYTVKSDTVPKLDIIN